jgi:hypothetical protein
MKNLEDESKIIVPRFLLLNKINFNRRPWDRKATIVFYEKVLQYFDVLLFSNKYVFSNRV